MNKKRQENEETKSFFEKIIPEKYQGALAQVVFISPLIIFMICVVISSNKAADIQKSVKISEGIVISYQSNVDVFCIKDGNAVEISSNDFRVECNGFFLQEDAQNKQWSIWPKP